MAYEFNHVHIKAQDPEKTANWYVKAFGFKILSDTTRVYGDRFIRCETSDGVAGQYLERTHGRAYGRRVTPPSTGESSTSAST